MMTGSSHSLFDPCSSLTSPASNTTLSSAL
jgi:hypothetical protein